MPITGAVSNDTYAAAGVMAARPATAPVSRPTKLGRRTLAHSRTSQVNPAKAAPSCVFTKDETVTQSTATSDPALKPNQPNHSNPAPSAINGTLCGAPVLSHLRPMNITEAKAENPAVVCTTIPPAKSNTPNRENKPSGVHTI